MVIAHSFFLSSGDYTEPMILSFCTLYFAHFCLFWVCAKHIPYFWILHFGYLFWFIHCLLANVFFLNMVPHTSNAQVSPECYLLLIDPKSFWLLAYVHWCSPYFNAPAFLTAFHDFSLRGFISFLMVLFTICAIFPSSNPINLPIHHVVLLLTNMVCIHQSSCCTWDEYPVMFNWVSICESVIQPSSSFLDILSEVLSGDT